MIIFIRRGADIVRVSVDAARSVAAAKLAYAATEGFRGDPYSINLSLGGKALPDSESLAALGISKGSVVDHQPSAPGAKRVDYGQVDEAFENDRRTKDFMATRGKWDTTWEKGDEWKSYPPVIRNMWASADEDPAASKRGGGGGGGGGGRSGELTRAAAPRAEAVALARAPAPTASHPIASTRRPRLMSGDEAETPPSTRQFRSLYIAQVGRFQFRLIHRMEGRWNGESELIVPGRGRTSTRICAVSLAFDDAAGVWREVQTLTTPDATGFTTKQTLVLTPIADGVLKVEGEDASVDWTDLDMRLEEQSENVLIMTAISHTTGKPFLVETTTFIDDYRRVRTVQRFDERGGFQCLYLIKESRVIDVVTGAVEPSDR